VRDGDVERLAYAEKWMCFDVFVCAHSRLGWGSLTARREPCGLLYLKCHAALRWQVGGRTPWSQPLRRRENSLVEEHLVVYIPWCRMAAAIRQSSWCTVFRPLTPRHFGTKPMPCEHCRAWQRRQIRWRFQSCPGYARTLRHCDGEMLHQLGIIHRSAVFCRAELKWDSMCFNVSLLAYTRNITVYHITKKYVNMVLMINIWWYITRYDHHYWLIT
jgi:hypothetical protein